MKWGGMVNSSIKANAKFDEVGKYCVVMAHPHAILAGTAVSNQIDTDGP